MRQERTVLRDVFPDAIVGVGIFSFLNNYDVPWKESVSHESLDRIYHFERSGLKPISPLTEGIISYAGFSEEEKRQKMASDLFAKFSLKWDKLYQTLMFEYDPISNYDMKENEEINREGSSSDEGSQEREDNLEHKKIGDNTDSETGTVGVVTKDGGSVSTTGTNKNNNQQSVYGYNASDAVPSDSGSSTGETSGKEERDLNGQRDETRGLNFGHKIDESVTDTGTVVTKDKRDGKTTGKEIRELTRSGNIGVTTSQQMIQSERNLWLWSFFDEVFADIDSLLVLPIY